MIAVLLASSSFLLSCLNASDQKSQYSTSNNSNQTTSSIKNGLTESSNQSKDSITSQTVSKDINADEAFDMLKNKQKYFLLDVRTKEEYDEGHLENSVLIPVLELKERISEIPTDKPVIIYCRTGKRSSNAAKILEENGFMQIYNMLGGITEWIEKGYPVVK